MSNNSSTSSGVGFTGLLLLAFIVLKLCKVIDWSWWWVLSPAWIPIAIVALIVIVWFVFKYPSWVAARKKAKRVKEIMRTTGMSEFVAGLKYNEENGIKSKWQKKMEEMHQAYETRRKQRQQ